MKTVLVKGLNEVDARDVRAEFKSCPMLRRQLIKVVEDKMRQSFKNSYAKEGYDSPNWAYTQADARGYERALSEIISLF